MSTNASPNVDIDRTIAALVAEFRDSPYQVERTSAAALRVQLNVADASWWEFVRRAGWESVYTYDIAFRPEAGTCSITDTQNDLRWVAGADQQLMPHLAVGRSINSGRVISFQRTLMAAPADGTVVDVSFNSEQARDRIREILTVQGWRVEFSLRQKIGMVAAGFGILIALAGVAVAIALGPA